MLTSEERDGLRRLVSDKKKEIYHRCERVERELDKMAGLNKVTPAHVSPSGGSSSRHNHTTNCSKCGAPFSLPSLDCNTCYIRMYNWQRRKGLPTDGIKDWIIRINEEAGMAHECSEEGCHFKGATENGLRIHMSRIHGKEASVSRRALAVVPPAHPEPAQELVLAHVADSAVDHPDHYNHGTIEVIDALEDRQLEFHEGNAVKYIVRAKHKGDELTDLKKARWYLDRRIAQLESHTD